MTYQVLYHPAVKKDLKPIPEKEKQRIRTSIEDKISADPAYFGKALKGSLKPFFKFRVGNYRVIYEVSGQNIHVLMIGDRKDVYRLLEKRK